MNLRSLCGSTLFAVFVLPSVALAVPRAPVAPAASATPARQTPPPAASATPARLTPLPAASATPARQTPPPAASATPARQTPPPQGAPVTVAFLLAGGAEVMDFSGPWSVFEYAAGGNFRLYTVAESRRPLRVSGGMQIIPDFSSADAPPPDVVVVPAEARPGAATIAWLRRESARDQLTMSVCSGAYVLADAGLLDGHTATLYHDQFDDFAKQFPRVTVRRGARFVEEGRLATAAGLSSGIDLALRVVERYFGRAAAEATAYNLEYQGRGWLDAASNAVYAQRRAGEIDPTCHMSVDPKAAPSADYHGHTYYFCNAGEKALFEQHPERYVK